MITWPLLSGPLECALPSAALASLLAFLAAICEAAEALICCARCHASRACTTDLGKPHLGLVLLVKRKQPRVACCAAAGLQGLPPSEAPPGWPHARL